MEMLTVYSCFQRAEINSIITEFYTTLLSIVQSAIKQIPFLRHRNRTDPPTTDNKFTSRTALGHPRHTRSCA